MIIILQGADATNNNLGKINISTQVTDEVNKMLSYYTKTIVSSQRILVQNFIDELQAFGLWSKLTHIYLPILAGQKEEVFFNIKKTYGADGVIADCIPSGDNQLLNNDGFRILSANTLVENLVIDGTNISDMDNSFFVYAKSSEVPFEIFNFFAIRKTDDSGADTTRFFKYNTITKKAGVFNGTDNSLQFDTVENANITPALYGYSSGQTDAIAAAAGVIQKREPYLSSETLYSNRKLNLIAQSNKYTQPTPTMSAIILGTYLSLDEVKKLNGLLYTLCSVF